MPHIQGRVATDGYCLQQAHRLDLTVPAEAPLRTARHLTHSPAARDRHWSVQREPVQRVPVQREQVGVGVRVRVRRRFWVEAMVCLAASLPAAALLVAPQLAERLTGQEPNGASPTDWAMGLFATVVAVSSASIAHAEWRRPRRR